MKHNVCGGWIEIRTDPKNTAYVVTEGGKKQDTGDDKVLEGDLQMRSEEERERLRNDAFAALEVKIDDQKHMAISKSRIEELQHDKDKNWDDPYAASKNLRRAFRADRKARQKQEALSEDLKDRMSLGINLLEENEDDRRRAGFVEFGQVEGETAILKAKSKPLFPQTQPTPTAPSLKLPPKQNNIKLKKVAESQQKRERIRKELGDNTRAALDPFLNNNHDNNYVNRSSSFFGSAIIPALRLKKGPDLSSSLSSSSSSAVILSEEKSTVLTGLGDYDSE